MRRSLPINRATPTRKLIRKSASAKDIRHLSEKVTLERVLGITATTTNGLTCNPYTGIIAYPAGCVIVLYNPRTNSQAHIFNPEKKTLTAVAFSSDGKYIVSGESGHNPRVRVWELGETVTQVAELNGHKFSINCVAFSPNLKYLVSIGDQHDMLVNIWNWKSGSKVACNKIGCKVRSVSFAENGSYFVTVGNRHVKFWYFDTEVESKSNVPTPVAGRSGILGELRNNCFCDVKCGIGDNSSNTYAVTKSGLLCSFNEKRILDRWVELRSSGASSLSVNEKYLFCGCTDGIIRVFHPTTMHFISTLPRPHFLGVDVAAGLDASHMVPKDNSVRYPHVVSLALDDDNDKLSVVYDDHSLYVWDVHDVKKVGKACSFLYHSACIWGLETYPFMREESHPCLPVGSFLTCSSDDTIRVWNIDDDIALNGTFPRNIYSKELMKIIYTDVDLVNIQDISSIPVTTASDMKSGVRCLRVSPDGQLLAAGDRSGNLRVYDLQFVDEIMKIEAHEAEILCVEFSDPESGYRLLATSSRDRLIHIFDIEKDFSLIQTVDDHASSVTAVKLNYDDGVFQLLSCGADKHIMLHTSQQLEGGTGMHFVRENTIAVGKATLYDMDIDPTRKFATTCGQDRNVRIYDIQAVKQTNCYKGALSEDGTLIKIQLDPSGLYAATSCSDKSVNIYDFEAGECSAVMYGHSELVTGLKFTRDGTRLISVSGDHCIFVWRLAPVFTQGIISRLEELGIPTPGNAKYIKDPMSALRNTFVIPKYGKDDVIKDVIEEEFSSADPSIFEKEGPNQLEGQFDYRFSVGQLPAWAQKQITGEENAETNAGFGVAHASGRWAQRVNTAPVLLSAALAEKTISVDNSVVIDKESKVASDDKFSRPSEAATDESVVKRGLPYSSHHKRGNGKSESVIYIPSNEEEFDAEISSSSARSSDKGSAKRLTTFAKIKDKIIRKSSSDRELSSSSRSLRSNTVESPKSARKHLGHSIVMSSRRTGLVEAIPQHVKEKVSSPKAKGISSSSPEAVKRRRISVPLIQSEFKPAVTDRRPEDWKESPRRNKQQRDKGELFEVHYVDAVKSDKNSENKVKYESKLEEDEAVNDTKIFQVTARSSTKSRKASSGTSQKAVFRELSTTSEQQIGEEGNAVDTDSMEEEEEEEEDEELSDSENLHSEHEDADDSLQSPLEHHFEYLAVDDSDENNSEEPYHVNSSPRPEAKQKKGQSFLSRCRSSISAKFLSRSQKSQGGKSSQLTEEQRKRIDTLKRVIDQNQNYGAQVMRPVPSKEAKRVKKLTAKSEPNLSLGVLPPGKVNRKITGARRGSGITAESHTDLRSVKEGKQSDDLFTKDRIKQLRTSSSSSISPTDREKSASDLISMFNLRSSTPKQKPDLSLNIQLIGAKGNRTVSGRSPGISPVTSPIKAKPSHFKDPKETPTQSVTRRRPKKPGDRPRLQNRPRSLVLTSHISLEDMIKDHCGQPHSDTEIDDDVNLRNLPPNQRPMADEKPAKKVRQATENIKELIGTSLIVRDIDIDDSVKSSDSKKSWIDNTVIFTEKPNESAEAVDTSKTSNHDTQAVKTIQDKDGELNTCTSVDDLEKVSASATEVQPGVEEICSETPHQTAKGFLSSEVELDIDKKSDQIAPESEKIVAESDLADEALAKECESVIGDLMTSFTAVSKFQDKAVSMPDSDTKSKVIGLLSNAYVSLAERVKQHHAQLEQNSGIVHSKTVDECARVVVAAMDVSNVENDKTKQVVNLLEHYSNTIVKLVELKLIEKQ